VRFEFGTARLHDDLACGAALAHELISAFWGEATAGGKAEPPAGPEEQDALFARVAGRLRVRSALAPDRSGLRDLSRRVVRLRVEPVLRGPAGVLVALRPPTALDYPRLWALPAGTAVEPGDGGPADTAARGARALGLAAVTIPPRAPVALGWDLITCNLVLLVAVPPLDRAPERGDRTLREVAGGREEDFLRRSPACPALAAALSGGLA
jgi:hypothetical protein